MDPHNRYIKTLLNDCKKNNRGAQKALYQFFYSYCLSICMRYAESQEDAVEIMHDGFMKVFTYIGKFDKKRPFKPWIRKIMINSALDHIKKQNKLKLTDGMEHLLEFSTGDQDQDSVSYEDLLEIIRKLPPAYGTVFNLRAIEGYKHEEVAEMLGISVGTSKSNYAKAKLKLRAYLSTYFGVVQ